MAKKITLIILGFILIIGLDFIGIHYYSKYLIGYTTIYVSSHQLMQRNKISNDDLKEVVVPKDYISEDVYIDKDDILDKYVKLSYSIPKGSFIYKSAIENSGKDINNTLLLDNEVNYDVYTSDIKVNSGILNKNMKVDLYLTIPNNGKPVSDLFLSNVRIIGLYDSNEKEIQNYDNDSRVHILSLAINKDDVSYLNKALMIGEIKIIISSDTYDDTKTSTLNRNSEIFSFLEW